LPELRDYAGAKASLARALELNPRYVEAYVNLGQLHRRTGHLAEAIAAWERALELNPRTRSPASTWLRPRPPGRTAGDPHGHGPGFPPVADAGAAARARPATPPPARAELPRGSRCARPDRGRGGLSSESLVVEIGPGTGILTEAMLRTGASVLAVELDRALIRLLSERLAGNPRFTIRSADALEFDFAQALHDDPRRGRALVVANIPYYITTPLILRLVRQRDLFESLFLTVQREVAERLTAAPGRKSYGSLTLACQYRASVRSVVAIRGPPSTRSRGGLGARPIRSAGCAAVRVAEPARLFAVIRAAFGVRRKTLRNALCRAAGRRGRGNRAGPRRGRGDAPG